MENSIFLKACRGKKTEKTPIWFMRQAGRYLPEYQEIRAKHSMLDVIRTPELTAEVTLQPIDRFGFDASIIFADILNILIGMGIDLDFVKNVGPVISNPIKLVSDVEKLQVPTPEENVAYTLEAIKLVTSELTPRNVPLIGFSGAPFTLSAYLIEGKSPAKLIKLKSFMFKEPKAWHLLQTKLVKLVSEYLIAQSEAGVSALQIFDSWAGGLGPREYSEFVRPYILEIISNVRDKTDVPLIYFAPAIHGYIEQLLDYNVNVIGIDWRIDLLTAKKRLKDKFVLQGNLDPLILSGNIAYLEKALPKLLEEISELGPHIFNLGHGILPHTPIENVHRALEIIRGLN